MEQVRYGAGSPEAREIVRQVQRAIACTERLNRIPYHDVAAIRAMWFELTGRQVDETFNLIPPVFSEQGLNIRVGRDVFINQGCTFLDQAGIRIGERVMIGPKVTFITGGHPVDPVERRQYLTGAPIDVAENVWIGAGATVLPGVSIGRDAVIAAGAVVADDVPAASLVTGPKATVRRRW